MVCSPSELLNLCLSNFRLCMNASHGSCLRQEVKWIQEFPHRNASGTMATALLCVLCVVFCATLAQDFKLKFKAATKPVRLFTEEELRRYDGSEVNFHPIYNLSVKQQVCAYSLCLYTVCGYIQPVSYSSKSVLIYSMWLYTVCSYIPSMIVYNLSVKQQVCAYIQSVVTYSL